MDELAQLFSSMETPEAMAEIQVNAVRAFQRDMSTQSQNIEVLPPDPTRENNLPSHIDMTNPNFLEEMMKQAQKNRFPVPKALPCANVQAAKYTMCESLGTMACSACKLVAYCSKECQTAHWRLHKRDCRDPIRSDDWTPSWTREGRRPFFIVADSVTVQQEFHDKKKEEFSVGLSLWGNTPAMDVINLTYNEDNPTKDFSLAFIASGDLRHVLRSVNGLPSNYSGSLKILINDINLPIVCRNIVLLLILGNIADEAQAADIALYFWYSAFMPMEYRLQIAMILRSFLQQSQGGDYQIRLGPTSTLHLCLPKDASVFFAHFVSSSFSVGDAQDEYNRVRTAHSRRDFRDRMYLGLKPSHRAAFKEYRRFGIVLPFGAMNAHFNRPNLSLFSPEGKWWQTDYADPLEGWDVDTLVRTGKKFGCHAEDIYGCFYFYLSEQLQMFARRLRETKVMFTVLSFDASNIPEAIQGNVFHELNLPSSIRFDRIAVSNIFDANYVGAHDVLTKWGPLLRKSKCAAIIGYFMNWTIIQEDGRAAGAGRKAISALSPQVMKRNKTRMKNSMDAEVMVYMALNDMEALYENSKPFSNFLKKQGLDALLKKTNLQLRQKHRIFPHRILTPLQGPANASPEFTDDDSWYNYTKLISCTWSERYVEFERA